MIYSDLVTSIREMEFGRVGVAELFRTGRKWVTVRPPDTKHEFLPGERVIANCVGDGERLVTRVVDSKVKPLEDIAPALLGLNGWINLPAGNASTLAALDLRMRGGKYSEITRKTPVVGIAIVTEDLWDSLEPVTRRTLVEMPFERAILTPEVKPVILPALGYWSSVRNLTGKDWLTYLRNITLISKEERNAVVDEMGGFWRAQVMNSRAAFREVVDNGEDDPIFQKLVLLRRW